VVSLLWVTYPGGRCEELFHCNGWPTQVEKNMKSGLVVIGDLPKWKEYEKWSHCYGWPTHKEKKRVLSL
jgi:hypothetical protein